MPIWNSLICRQGQTEGEENQEESADESFNEGSEVEENQDDSPVTDPYEDGASDNPGQIVENSEEDRPAENMPESNQEEEPPGSAEDKDQGIPESTDHGDNSKDNDAAAGVRPARDAAENNTMDAVAGGSRECSVTQEPRLLLDISLCYSDTKNDREYYEKIKNMMNNVSINLAQATDGHVLMCLMMVQRTLFVTVIK